MTVENPPAEPWIEVTPGPYVLHGDIPVTRRTYVESEDGEPLTTVESALLDAGDGTALCRCGHSSNKPFCDGTHQKIGFDGTEKAPTTTYAERAKTLPGEGVTMRDDVTLCTHAGFCGLKDSSVWDMIDETADTEKRSLLMAMVSRCPSGRLTYSVPESDGDVEPDLRPGIHVAADGALEVTGGIPVVRNDGKAFETRHRMSLCRCGASKTKPLCNGNHVDIDFADS